MKISRHQIIAFAAVAKERSFSRAAKQLDIGQSAVTQHISALESVIGAKLFTRSRSGSPLTSVGRELFSLADKIHVLEEQFFEKAHQYMNLKEGHLSICVSTSRPAMALISAFKQAFPGIHIDLTVAPWRDALKLVQLREVDLAITIKPEEIEQNLYFQDIEERSFMAILPVGHVLSHRSSLTINDLLSETVVMLGESSYTRFCVNTKLKQLGVIFPNTLTTSSYEMMFEAVIHGLGVSIALEKTSVDYHGIVTVPIQEFSEKHAYSLICLKSKAPLRVIESFIKAAALYSESEMFNEQV
jgi:DNA-binding transcriptional LysR family regulator